MKILILLLALWSGAAHAFPAKPVKIIVAFPPGGGTDIAARADPDGHTLPYKGSGPGMNDLLGGRVMMTMDSLLQSLPHIKAGRLKALAVLGPKRSSLLPDVPTMAEADVVGNPSEEFGAAMRAESAQWADIIRTANIKAE